MKLTDNCFASTCKFAKALLHSQELMQALLYSLESRIISPKFRGLKKSSRLGLLCRASRTTIKLSRP